MSSPQRHIIEEAPPSKRNKTANQGGKTANQGGNTANQGGKEERPQTTNQGGNTANQGGKEERPQTTNQGGKTANQGGKTANQGGKTANQRGCPSKKQLQTLEKKDGASIHFRLGIAKKKATTIQPKENVNYTNCFFRFQKLDGTPLDVMVSDLLALPEGFTGDDVIKAAYDIEKTLRTGVFSFDQVEYQKIQEKKAKVYFAMEDDGPKWDSTYFKTVKKDVLLSFFVPPRYRVVFDVELKDLHQGALVDINLL